MKLGKRFLAILLCAAMLAATPIFPAAAEEFGATVYLDAANGLDTNSGFSREQAVKTMSAAYTALSGAMSGKSAGEKAKLVLVSDYTIDFGTGATISQPAHSFELVMTGERPDVTLLFANTKQSYLVMGGPTTFENMGMHITENSGSPYVSIHGKGGLLRIGEGVTTSQKADLLPMLAAGPRSAYTGDLTMEVASGSWRAIYAANYTTATTGKVNFTMSGGSTGKIATNYNNTQTGDVTINLTGGTVDVIQAGSANSKGTVKGNITINLNGGTVTGDIGAGAGTISDGTLTVNAGGGVHITKAGDTTVDNLTGNVTLGISTHLTVANTITDAVAVTVDPHVAFNTYLTAPADTQDSCVTFTNGSDKITVATEGSLKNWLNDDTDDQVGVTLKASSNHTVKLYSGASHAATDTPIAPTSSRTEGGMTYYFYANVQGTYHFVSSRNGYYTLTKILNITPEKAVSQAEIDANTSRRRNDGGFESVNVKSYSDETLQNIATSDENAAWWEEYSPYLITPAFQSGREEHLATTQEEMDAFIASLDKDNDNMYVFSMGTSPVYGYDMPIVIFTETDLSDAETLEEAAALVTANGKMTMHYQAQIHGNEPAAGEAALAMMGRLQGDLGGILDTINIYVIPRLNPDGSRNYTRNNGANSDAGINMNRDLLLTSSYEVQRHHYVLNLFNPEMAVDAHEYTAEPEKSVSANAYNDMMMSVGFNGNSGGDFAEFCKEYLRSTFQPLYDNGMRPSYYTDVLNGKYSASGTNYRGQRGCVSVLMESRGIGAGNLTYERRVVAHLIAMEGLFDYIENNTQKIYDAVHNERQRLIDSGTTYEADDAIVLEHATTVDSSQAYQSFKYNLVDGTLISQQMKSPSAYYEALPGRSRPRPTAYVIPAGESWTAKVLEIMDNHGIRYTYVDPGSAIRLQQYTGTVTDEAVTADLTAEQLISFPHGAYVLTMNQQLSTILAILMEPDIADEYNVDNGGGALTAPTGTLVQMRIIPCEDGIFPIYRYVQDLNGDGFVDVEAPEPRVHESHCICGGIGAKGEHAFCNTVTDWVAINRSNFFSADAAGNSIVRIREKNSNQLELRDPTKRHYYLEEDVDLTAAGAKSWLTLSSREFTICLNGHTLNLADSQLSAYNGKITICDCAGGGKLIANGVVLNVNTNTSSMIRLFGGTVKGKKEAVNVSVGKFLQYGGTIDQSGATDTAAYGIYAKNNATVELRGGTVIGGPAPAVYMTSGNFHQYGGIITTADGTTSHTVQVKTAQDMTSNYTQHGGTVIGNGGYGVYMNPPGPSGGKAFYTMQGGEIVGGSKSAVLITGSTGYDSANYVCFVLKDGKVTGKNSADGNALYLNYGEYYLDGGSVSGTGNAVYVKKGNLIRGGSTITGDILNTGTVIPVSQMPAVTQSDSLALTSPEGEIKLVHDDVYDYYTSTDSFVPEVDYTRTTAPAKEDVLTEYRYPKGAALSWTALSSLSSFREIRVRVSEDPAMNDPAVYTLPVTASSCTVKDLIPGRTYCWDVQYVAKNGDITTCKKTSSFATAPDQPRFIGSDTVGFGNLRDVGGKKIVGTDQYTNFGVAFRGAEAYGITSTTDARGKITEEGIDYMTRVLGIRTELDFRKESERAGQNASVLGVQYLVRNMAHYNSAVTYPEAEPRTPDAIRVFSRAENYPIYFHCVGGLDRTGTVATLLQLVCGVSEADAVKDYELSTFMSNARYRNNTCVASADPDGYIKAMNVLKSMDGADLKEKTQNYFHQVLGLSWQEVDNIVGMFVGNQAVFTEDSLNVLTDDTHGKVTVDLLLRDSQVPDSITANGNALPFTASQSEGVTTLTVDAESLENGEQTAELHFGNVTRRVEMLLSHAGQESVVTVYTGNTAVKTYPSLQAAANDCPKGSYLKLTDDVTEDMTCTGDLFLDLNGHTFTGTVTMSNGKVFYGMDTSTDTYGDAAGRFVGTVEGGTLADHSRNDTTKRRYVTVKGADESYTFNRIYVGVTKIAYNTASEGVGYKTTIVMNQAIIDHLRTETDKGKCGITLWLDGGAKKSYAIDPSDFVAGEHMETTAMIVNQFEAVAQGKCSGATPVYAEVYANLQGAANGDFSVISSTYSYSLRQIMGAIDTEVPKLPEDSVNMQNLIATYQKYEKVLENWMPNLRGIATDVMESDIPGNPEGDFD